MIATNIGKTFLNAYNEKHHIVPKTIFKEVRDVLETMTEISKEAGVSPDKVEDLLREKRVQISKSELETMEIRLQKEMKRAAKDLDFEEAARLRDILLMLKAKAQK